MTKITLASREFMLKILAYLLRHLHDVSDKEKQARLEENLQKNIAILLEEIPVQEKIQQLAFANRDLEIIWKQLPDDPETTTFKQRVYKETLRLFIEISSKLLVSFGDDVKDGNDSVLTITRKAGGADG